MINPSNVTTPCTHAKHCLCDVHCKYMRHCYSMHSPGRRRSCYNKLQGQSTTYNPFKVRMIDCWELSSCGTEIGMMRQCGLLCTQTMHIQTGMTHACTYRLGSRTHAPTDWDHADHQASLKPPSSSSRQACMHRQSPKVRLFRHAIIA